MRARRVHPTLAHVCFARSLSSRGCPAASFLPFLSWQPGDGALEMQADDFRLTSSISRAEWKPPLLTPPSPPAFASCTDNATTMCHWRPFPAGCDVTTSCRDNADVAGALAAVGRRPRLQSHTGE